MKHTTKLAMLAGSLATTLAVAVGAAAFSGSGPSTVALVERTAAEATTTTAPAPTLAPSTTVAPVAPQTTLAGRTVASVTTKPASAAPAPTVAPVAAPVPTTAPAETTTTVPAPTWTVRYVDGTTKVLTSPPPMGRTNERTTTVGLATRTDWEQIVCRPEGPNFSCVQTSGWTGN